MLFLTCIFGGQLGEGWEREFLCCSFSTPADGTEAAANLKGSAHSADPLEKHGVVWWCIAGFEGFSVSSDPYLDFRLPLAYIRAVIYSMLHNSASGLEIGH